MGEKTFYIRQVWSSAIVRDQRKESETGEKAREQQGEMKEMQGKYGRNKVKWGGS